MTASRTRPAHAAPRLRRRAFLQLAAAGAAVPLPGGTAGAGQGFPRSLDLDVIQSGHSLTDPIVPMLDAIVASVGGRSAMRRIDRSTVPGSPMDWRWNNRNEHLPDAREAIADYDVLVLTERVPLSNTMEGHASEDMALRWFTHAWTNGSRGNGAATVLYATWVHIDSGPDFENVYHDPEAHIPFRDRLPLEMARWEAIQAHVNTNRPAGSPPMRMIPGPLILDAVAGAIEDGTAPGLDSLDALFSDTIHVNDAGAYLIALAHYAVIYGRDPRDLPRRIGKRGQPEPELSAWMRDLVWKTVRAYPGTGLDEPG
ncbi:MAG: hypothetical protein ACLFRZ_01240 [Rhodosalinus sp.]